MHSFGAAEYGMENSETKAKFFLAASSQDYLPNMDEWKTAVRCGTVQILIMLDISCREYKNKRICMATGQYPCRMSGASTGKRQASQFIMVCPCLSS